MVGQPSDLLHVDGGADVEVRGSMRKALSDHGHWSGEIVNRRATGELFHEHLSLTMVQDHNGKVLHYIGIFTDISQVKAQQEKLERLARYDMLTSLPNRTLLADRLNTAISLSRRTGDKTGVALIDLDGFKAINDAYGHGVGDIALAAFAPLAPVATLERQAATAVAATNPTSPRLRMVSTNSAVGVVRRPT